VLIWAVIVPFITGQLWGAKVVDRQCYQRDCLTLVIENGKVLGQRSGGFSPGNLELGKYDVRGASLVSAKEAPVLYSKTRRGWVGLVAAYIPEEALLWPQLRLYIFDPQGHRTTTQDLYIRIGSEAQPNFRIGALFNTNSEFLQVSTDGEHSYVVRTLIWLLPDKGAPRLLLDEPSLVNRVQQSSAGRRGGIWTQRETYDGVHAETKGSKSEFWAWDEDQKALQLVP